MQISIAVFVVSVNSVFGKKGYSHKHGPERMTFQHKRRFKNEKIGLASEQGGGGVEGVMLR